MAAYRLMNNFRNIPVNNKTTCFKLLNTHFQQLNLRFLSSKNENTVATNSSELAKKKKTIPIPKITLVSQDENIQITSLEEAQKIAKRRDLKLVKIIDLDTKTQRPIYKLMTGNEYHAEDLKQREIRKEKKNDTIKGEKMLLLNSKISEHDLESRIKNILKWINKKYEVRVVISGDSVESCEKVYNTIEESIKSNARFLQKRIKNNELKFNIHPPKIINKTAAETL